MKDQSAYYEKKQLLRLAANINLDKVLAQHHAILTAIKAKNPEQAEQAMELHLVSREIDILRNDISQFV